MMGKSELSGPALRHTAIMAVLNITPDSFYPGSRYQDPEGALGQASKAVEAGAGILDIGGESSRPGADPVSPAEEQDRILPVLEALLAQFERTGVRISVDTYHADTARKALELGASMINDITALRVDPAMAETIAAFDCECVLMHMQGDPKTMQLNPVYSDVVEDVCGFFEERLEAAIRAGIPEDRIWLDPGFGFGKTTYHNLELLRRLPEFKRFGRPILVGTSNKSTIGNVLQLPLGERLEGTAATVAVAVYNGADAVRVHDVTEMARVVRMTEAILHPHAFEGV